MRDGCPVSPLGEAVELGKGGSWGADSPAPGRTEAFCLRGTDLAELIQGKHPEAPRRWLTESELSKSRCKPDMVLIETSGSKCGRSLVLTKEMLDQFELPVVYSNFCRTLKIDTSKLSSGYAELWFSHNYWNGVIPSYRATSAMPNLDVKSLLRMETLLIPPLEMQQRTVDLVSSVDSYIAALQQQADAARVARNAVLSELLFAGGDDWTETTIGAIAEVVGGGTPATNTPEYWGGEIVWLTPTEVVPVDGQEIHDSERRITSAGLKNSGAQLLPPGSVILTTRASVGFAALSTVELCTNQGFQSLIPGDRVMAKFLMFWIQVNRHELQSRAAGSTFKEISKSNIKSLKINLPPWEEQKQIVELVSSIDEVIQSAEQAVADAKRLRSGLLSDLLSGSHEIPESYDRLLGAT